MSGPQERLGPELALVIPEADPELMLWIRENRRLVLRVFPDDRAIGAADRQLASNILVIMHVGDDLGPTILLAYAIQLPFVLEKGGDLPSGYPRLAARENYWTAKLHELPDYPAWSVVTQDVEARSEELGAVTPADTPPVIWLDAAVAREKRLSPEWYRTA